MEYSDNSNDKNQELYKAETYMKNGLTRPEALSFIETLRTQEHLMRRMETNKVSSHDGRK